MKDHKKDRKKESWDRKKERKLGKKGKKEEEGRKKGCERKKKDFFSGCCYLLLLLNTEVLFYPDEICLLVFLFCRMGVAFAGSNGENMEIKTFGKSEK